MTVLALRKNIVSLFVLQGANYLIPLINLPYLIRTLGPEAFGAMVLAMAVSQYFVVLTDYGFNFSATQRISVRRAEVGEVRKISISVWGIKTTLALIGSIAFFFTTAAFSYSAEMVNIYCAAFSSVLGTVLLPIWLFQGTETLSLLTHLTIAAKAICAFAIFALVGGPQDIVLATLLQSCSPALTALLCCSLVRRRHLSGLSMPSWSETWQIFTEGWYTFLSSASVTLYTTSNIVILGAFASPTTVAYFAAAERLMKAVVGLIQPISQAVYPHVCQLVSVSRQHAAAFLGRLFNWVVAAGAVASLCLATLGPYIVAPLFGAEMEPAGTTLRLMALAPIAVAISNILGVQTLLAFGFSSDFSRILLRAGTVNVLIAVPAAYWFGDRGMALTLTLVEILVALSCYRALRKKQLLPYAALAALPQ